MFLFSKFNDSSHFRFATLHKWDHLQLLEIRFDDLIVKTSPTQDKKKKRHEHLFECLIS